MGDTRIHDIGYQRYSGPRRPQGKRASVIAVNAIRQAWKGWFRLRMSLFGLAVVTIALGSVMYISGNQVFSLLTSRTGGPLAFRDGIIGFAYQPFLFPLIAFVLSISVCARAVADDRKAGAFEFYFTRPLRIRDYVGGKFAGAFALMWIVLGLGPLALSLFRLGLSSSLPDAIDGLGAVGKVLVVSTLASAAYAALPLSIGAAASNARQAVALWVVYYLLAGPVIMAVAHVTKTPELALLDLGSCVRSFAFGMFDFALAGRPIAPGWMAATTLAGITILSLVFAHQRLAKLTEVNR